PSHRSSRCPSISPSWTASRSAPNRRFNTMRSIRNAAFAAALLCVSFAAGAQQQRQIEVGNYPTAGALTGSERMLSDQAGITVDILPIQIAQYLATSGAIFSMLPSPL